MIVQEYDRKTSEELEKLSTDIGDKLLSMVDDTVANANEFLKPYGLKVQMQFVLEPTDPSGEAR